MGVLHLLSVYFYSVGRGENGTGGSGQELGWATRLGRPTVGLCLAASGNGHLRLGSEFCSSSPVTQASPITFPGPTAELKMVSMVLSPRKYLPRGRVTIMSSDHHSTKPTILPPNFSGFPHCRGDLCMDSNSAKIT